MGRSSYFIYYYGENVKTRFSFKAIFSVNIKNTGYKNEVLKSIKLLKAGSPPCKGGILPLDYGPRA